MADGLPKPLRIATKLEAHFYKSFHQYKDQMSIEKNFHQPVSELPAKQHGRYGPFRLYRLHCLATNSETGWWKNFLMIIWSLYGWKLTEKWIPNFVAIRKGYGSPSASCECWHIIKETFALLLFLFEFSWLELYIHKISSVKTKKSGNRYSLKNHSRLRHSSSLRCWSLKSKDYKN